MNKFLWGSLVLIGLLAACSNGGSTPPEVEEKVKKDTEVREELNNNLNENSESNSEVELETNVEEQEAEDVAVEPASAVKTSEEMAEGVVREYYNAMKEKNLEAMLNLYTEEHKHHVEDMTAEMTKTEIEQVFNADNQKYEGVNIQDYRYSEEEDMFKMEAKKDQGDSVLIYYFYLYMENGEMKIEDEGVRTEYF